MKNYLFIDGTNLYAGQYELFRGDNFLSFPEFIKTVEKKLNIDFAKIYFYASYSPKSKKPTTKEKNYLKNEAFFYKKVKETNNLVFFKGYRSPSSKKEKEVDVKLAVDIVHFAHLGKYDSMYLLTGDADFMHALWTVQTVKKKANILCLENKIMYKAVYFFPTTIICFNNPDNCLPRKLHGYKVMDMSREKLLRNTNKKPGIHVYRAG